MVWLLSKLISRLVEVVSSHLQSSQELMERISRLPEQSIRENGYPFSLDVAALYTSVPPQEAIKTVTQRLTNRQFSYHGLTVFHINKILSCILSNRRFKFNNIQFEQVQGLAMGSRLSGILSTLVMDDLEKQTITADLRISVYARYVDDIFMLTDTKETANKIYNKFNRQHADIKFTIEHPSDDRSLSLLDFQISTTNNAVKFNYFQKITKKNMFPHYRSAMPDSQKAAFIRNEHQRITQRCSDENDRIEETSKFQNRLTTRGYTREFVNAAISRRNTSDSSNNDDPIDEAMFIKFPYINDSIDRKIKTVLKRARIDARITRRGRNIRSMLSKSNENQCTSNCGTKNCQHKQVVYQFDCGCSNSYIGSTKRTLHSRVSEHLHPTASQKPTSVTLHRNQCNNDFAFNIIDRGCDVVDTRIKEGILIHQNQPSLNEKDELTNWLELIGSRPCSTR